MEDTGVFLSSEDLLMLISSQRKSSILLPVFDEASSLSGREIILRLHSLIRDEVLTYGQEDGKYEINGEFRQVVDGICSAEVIAEFSAEILSSVKFYLYVSCSGRAVLVEPAKNRNGFLKLSCTDVDGFIDTLIDSHLLPAGDMKIHEGRSDERKLLNGLSLIMDKKELNLLSDETVLTVKLFKSELSKEIIIMRREEIHAVAVIKDGVLNALPYSPEILAKEIRKW